MLELKTPKPALRLARELFCRFPAAIVGVTCTWSPLRATPRGFLSSIDVVCVVIDAGTLPRMCNVVPVQQQNPGVVCLR